jgi:hypothetical protein
VAGGPSEQVSSGKLQSAITIQVKINILELSVVTHTCNPSAQGQSRLHSETLSQMMCVDAHVMGSVGQGTQAPVERGRGSRTHGLSMPKGGMGRCSWLLFPHLPKQGEIRLWAQERTDAG